MAVSGTALNVEIEGESYSLDIVPAETSSVVAIHKETLLGAVDLDSLVKDLHRVGSFIRIAYNGVGAAGPKFTELKIKIQRIGFDITKLCANSALTVAKFKTASKTVLVDLQATYKYLLANHEVMAVGTLAHVSKLAGEMEKAALELHHQFEAQAEKVFTTKEETERAESDEANRITMLQKERQDFENKKQYQLKLMEDAQALERDAKAERLRYEDKEDKAIRETANPLKLLANAVTSTIGLGKVFDDAAEAAQWKQKRIEALQKENEYRQQRYGALQKMSEFALKVSHCTTEENMAAIAVDALHHAIGALKHLSVVMMRAAQFWKQMHDHCHSLAEGEMQEQVKLAMTMPKEDRRDVWTGDSFKMKAIHFYAGWVALHSVCSGYMEQIKQTQEELYEYLKENPTWEESRQNVKELADTFAHDLQQDTKAIAEKEFEAQREIEALADQ